MAELPPPPKVPEQMSELTTPRDRDSPVFHPSHATVCAPGALQAPVLNRLLTVFGLWLAVGVLYWPSVIALNALWLNTAEETYTHGYLVLLISLWLIVRDRKRLAAAPIQPARLALIALALLSVMWMWSWRAVIQEAHLMLLPLILFAAVIAAFGWRVARVLAFPIGYLYFAMPMWSDINWYVQSLSAKMSEVLIWITGLPAYMQGDYAHLPGGTIEIARSCSGLHELIVGLALATLYGEITREPLRRRLKWIGMMGALSLLVNWVRIFVVFAAAYFSHMNSSLVRHHYWMGWWLFASVFAGFLWWTRNTPPAGGPVEKPQAPHAQEEASPRAFSLAQITATLAVLAVLPTLAYSMDLSRAGARTAVEVIWPTAAAGWRGPEPVSDSQWHPKFIRASGESLRQYTDASGQPVQVFTVAYRVQTQDAKLLGYWNHLLGARNRWTLRRRWVRIVTPASGQWRETLAVDRAGTRSLIWARYRVGNRLFVRPRLSQLWYGLEAMAPHPPLSSLTALRAICTPDCKAARSRLSMAATWLQPALRQLVPINRLQVHARK